METNTKNKMDEILSHYSGRRDELIPILEEAQEQFRYLPAEVMQKIAKFLRLSDSTVFSVASFYALFKFVPSGRRTVRVCRGTACHVRGAPQILSEVEKHLCIKQGETSKDMEYSLETIACFGSCALAPVMVIDKKVYGRMTPAKVEQILSDNKQDTGK